MFALTLISPTSIHPNAGIISQNGNKKNPQKTRCLADTKHLQLLWKGAQTLHYSQNVFIKRSTPDSMLSSFFLSLSVGVCV